MSKPIPQPVYLKDYTPPAYDVDHVNLTFQIFDGKTIVKAKTDYTKSGKGPLVLNGEHMTLNSIALDGSLLTKDVDYTLDGDTLIIPACEALENFTLEIETECDPAANTRLEGLYQSKGIYCTQCEAESFRSITYFQDRPDVMTTFTVRIEAHKDSAPVLLSNGNLIDSGVLDGNRHFATYEDPFKKPCYLFALVAGELEYIEDKFTTMSGRDVTLRIYVRDGDQDQCHFAMESLKHSMKWDEDKYGREYNYSRFDIVAVSDFNMGGMENTSLNIFNTAVVLADPETATDRDFERVEGVIAHEYFHNWSGNLVTCQNWFQLSLKEGLTVFRDQQFSGDMNSAQVQRIDDVDMLRTHQFPEDAGPTAHPIRPDSYIEMNNFYTVTVYKKGAEVIHMMYNMLGPETYRKATDLYFSRHYGQAVTCEDFVKCMEDVSGKDLSQFFLWYTQAGTPEVNAETQYDADTQTFTLTLSQSIPDTPGQTDKKPMHIPIGFGLISPSGEDMIAEEMLDLTQDQQVFTFTDIKEKPVPSILRGFSAPVKLSTDLTDDELRFLMVQDTDGFNQWESGQQYALRVIHKCLDAGSAKIPDAFLDSIDQLLDLAGDPLTDKALIARALTLPSMSLIIQQRKNADPDAIQDVLDAIYSSVLDRSRTKIETLYKARIQSGPFENTSNARTQRSLKNRMLSYIGTAKDQAVLDLAKKQYDTANNMTDRMGALSVLCDIPSPEKKAALQDYYARFNHHDLAMDKWFSIQTSGTYKGAIDDIKALRKHQDFNIKNPNRVRSLYSAFAMLNPVTFHNTNGEGYEFLADAIIELNIINPQIASRLLTPFKSWKQYTQDRQDKMKAQLERIAAEPNLSPNVYEIVNQTLGTQKNGQSSCNPTSP